jgi:hypothetical protein
MRILVASLCFLGCASPLAAEDSPAPQDRQEFFDGLDELADGMRRLFEGFQSDVARLMEDLTDSLKGLGEYHPPEVLPNGDIIIRRKRPDATPAPAEPEEDGAIDI